MVERPDAVREICFVSLIPTVAALVFGGIGLWDGLAGSSICSLIFGLFMLLSGTIFLIGIGGFWRLQRWGYWIVWFLWTRGGGITLGPGKNLSDPEIRKAFGFDN